MNLRFVLDEHLRGFLWHAVQRHNNRGKYVIDVTRVGDPIDLPLGCADPDILVWAEREQRVLVSLDEATLLTYLRQHLAAGRRSPGVFIVRAHTTLVQIVDFLAAATYASDAVEWVDRASYIP